MTRAARRPTALLAALLVAVLAPAAARAEREPGRRAPDLRATATLLAPAPLSMDGLRGRLVLLVFFKPDCPHCRASVPALNALERDGFARGLRVVGASRDPRAAVEAFVRDLGVEFPVALVDTEVLRDYEVSGFPSAFLVAPDGRIVWTGAPAAITADELDRRLSATPPWPDVPATFQPLLVALRADRWGEAAAGFGVCSAPGACDATTAAAAAAMLRWIDRAAAGQLAAAEADLARGDPYEAWRALDRLARGFGDRGVGPRAARRVAELLADPGRAREIAAGRDLEAARGVLAADGRGAGVAALDRVAAAHPGTDAGAAAAALSRRGSGAAADRARRGRDRGGSGTLTPCDGPGSSSWRSRSASPSRPRRTSRSRRPPTASATRRPRA
ncbi:MAG: TlpA disulfide reductase family protein [Planctomycetota bacterium]